MDKSVLHLHTGTEASKLDAEASKLSRKISALLDEIESTQKRLSGTVTSCISNASHDLIPIEDRFATIKDVVQNSWVKILNSPEREITSLAGFLTFIARSESIDEIRRRKRKFAGPLPLDYDGEVLQGKVLFASHQGTGDPAAEYELKEFLSEIVDAVVQMPDKERYAMICAMKNDIGDPLEELFMEHGIDIGPVCWPQDQKELQSARSLVSVARRKLRAKFHRPVCHNEKLSLHA